jgi:hypothetical protein
MNKEGRKEGRNKTDKEDPTYHSSAKPVQQTSEVKQS